MRDLHASELGFVYGAGGGGKKSCGGGNGGSKKHNSKKHGTRGKSGGSKRCG
ncbi:MAG: hypothetical protein QOH81_350 [Sphingomonadales bacterium]|jgi:hypothetical protein|nr:hypothetical protein [Sphingomonadales bacterium]